MARNEVVQYDPKMPDQNINVKGYRRYSVARISEFTVSVGATATVILRLNHARLYAVIVNDSANDVYLSFSPNSVVGSGIRLNALGGTIIFGLATDIPFTGDVYGIAVAASNVTVVES